MIVVGVDVGGTKLLACAAEAPGPPVRWTRRPTGREVDADGLVALVADVVDDLAAGAPVGAIGLGFPGLVDQDGQHVHASVILPEVGAFALGLEVAERVGAPCRVANDVDCAARAELAHRPDAGDLLFVTAGTGIGGAVVLDGQVRHGARGLAGEVGHLTIQADGPPCPCGGVGCLHLYAGGRAIEAALGLAEGDLHHVDLDTDPAAAAAVAAAGRALGVGIANVVAMLDITLAVVGGGLANLGDRYLAPVRQGFRSSAMSGLRAGFSIEPARAGPTAGAAGAALHAADAGWVSPEA